MFRQDRTNPSTAVSNWRGRHDASKGWPSTAVSTWLNGGLFGGAVSLAGYWFGGYNGWLSGLYATVDKLSFADDSMSTLGTGLSAARRNNSGFASTVAGYSVGGEWAKTTDVDRFVFADDTRTTLGTGLSVASDGAAGMASPVAGYYCGGNTS